MVKREKWRQICQNDSMKLLHYLWYMTIWRWVIIQPLVLPGEFINFQNAFVSSKCYSYGNILQHSRLFSKFKWEFVRDNKVFCKEKTFRQMGYYIALDLHDVSYVSFKWTSLIVENVFNSLFWSIFQFSFYFWNDNRYGFNNKRETRAII